MPSMTSLTYVLPAKLARSGHCQHTFQMLGVQDWLKASFFHCLLFNFRRQWPLCSLSCTLKPNSWILGRKLDCDKALWWHWRVVPQLQRSIFGRHLWTPRTIIFRKAGIGDRVFGLFFRYLLGPGRLVADRGLRGQNIVPTDLCTRMGVHECDGCPRSCR